MNALRKKFLLVATAGVATWIFIQSPSAQNIDHAAAAQSAIKKVVTERAARSQSPAAADDRADAAMTGAASSLPTEADKSAIEKVVTERAARSQSPAAADRADAAMTGAASSLPTEADRKAAAAMSK
jgi:hypothetical protein